MATLLQGREEVRPRPHAVETNESDGPLHIGALGADGVVVEPEYLQVNGVHWELARVAQDVRPYWSYR